TISRELSFNLEDTVNFRDIRESQKKLYDLGIFQRVDVEAVPLEGNGSDEDESTNRMQQVQNYQIKAHVHELQPYRLRYGIHFDTEKYFGLKGELVDRNFLGRAQLIGTSFRINQDEQDIKAFIRSPYFLGWKINTETFAFFNRTHKPSFSVDRTGLTFLQQVKLNKFYLLSFDYTYEQSRTFNLKLSSPMDFNPTAQIGSFNLSLTRDTRDSMTNAREGMFLSHNIKYAPKFLGSDTRFVRYFGQAYIYIPVADSLVYSTGLRMGLAKGIRSDLIPSERFFAGGSSTVRGFGKDALGPRDLMTGDPVGGEAVFIFNQELRFPVYKILGGAVFMDLGNVYSRLSDFDPFDIRKTAGLGLRVHTSFMIFRLDWGFKLDPQPGEPRYKFFLSVGQAF
ncbi:MAG TPA: BamA/TamA family outer membrane protein, partial [Acidobacteriota bacterium]|nr:BamA/TamA family outer membrane protein [Acidobacteriota bacterium]